MIEPYTVRMAIVLALAAATTKAQTKNIDCRPADPSTANVAFHLNGLPNSCFLTTGGYSNNAGSFAAFSAFLGDYLHQEETIQLGAQYGVRSRSVQLGLTRPLVRDNHVQAGFALYAQRFRFDESQEASLLAFTRDVTETQSLNRDDWLQYVSHRYGSEAFVNVVLPDGFSSAKLSYSYDITGIRPFTEGASDYFGGVHFLNSSGTNRLSGIHTSRVVASFLHNTIVNPLRPAQGMMLSASFGVAGLGGDVNLIEPAIEAKWFHRGLWRRHVVAAHFRGSLLSGFGGKAAPPFFRDYMGGEQEIRGFSSWALSPFAYLPGTAAVPVLDVNGNPVLTAVNGSQKQVPITMNIPVYRPVAIGADTKIVGNLEYRIPLAGPFTLALFTDAGMDRVSFAGQLRLNSEGAGGLPEPTAPTLLQQGAQPFKMSSGVELQVLPPKMNVPLRLYWAYNAIACTSAVAESAVPACNLLAAPFLSNAGNFPNRATYQNALAMFGPQIVRDPRSMLRIAIGFSF